MATGRTLSRFERVYVDGYDLSGYGRTIGPLTAEYDVVDMTAPMSDAVKGYLINQININCGTFNGVMQSTTDSGIEVSAIQLPGVQRDVMVPVGIRAAPAIGDPVFCCKLAHSGFHVVENGGAITITADFSGQDAADINLPAIPWGVLLHNKEAETAANSSTTDSVLDPRGTTTTGGFMMYQIFAGDIDGKIDVQSSDTNVDGDFANVDGLELLTLTAPSAGIISTTATTTTINQYTRWQLTVNTGNTITFALALVRGQ